ncbi:MAG TPA: hypothetical protein VMB73_08860 [Acetobacteraceae bacterium]|nr:hypothetical protein [Acetobacteraceae bacterium]
MSILTDAWEAVRTFYGGDGGLHTGALVAFTALIPFFSLAAVLGSNATRKKRMQALRATFPDVARTEAHELWACSANRIALWHYIIPLVFLFLLNVFFSAILLDAGGWTDQSITRRVFLLCGAHCLSTNTDAAGTNLAAYELQTLVTVSYAFLGWMIWTFTTIFDRAATQELYPATFNRLLIRLAVAVLVAIVARHLAADPLPNDTDSTLSASGPILAFIIGMFPERGLAWITQKFSNLTRAPAHSEDFGLELIEGIDPATTYRMQELGLNDGADLARANPFTIFEAVAIPMTEAIDWIAQAQLLLLVKAERFQTLQKAGYRTIFDVVRLLRTPHGSDTARTLCNWEIADGYDQVAAIASDGDYSRIVAVNVALGGIAP